MTLCHQYNVWLGANPGFNLTGVVCYCTLADVRTQWHHTSGGIVAPSRHFYTQTFWHQDILTPRLFDTQTFCHPDVLPPRHFATPFKVRHFATPVFLPPRHFATPEFLPLHTCCQPDILSTTHFTPRTYGHPDILSFFFFNSLVTTQPLRLSKCLAFKMCWCQNVWVAISGKIMDSKMFECQNVCLAKCTDVELQGTSFMQLNDQRWDAAKG